MTTPFPNTPGFTGYNAPSRVEADIFDLEVVGELPRSLKGTWYRLTPDPQFPPLLGDDFYISGDGMISSFRFEDGFVDYKSRYVRTERFMAERKARRALFGAYRNRFTDDAKVAGLDRTVANTTPVWHAGRLLAIKEDGLPYEIDPDTLETRGRYDWGGKLRSKTVSAHPKIDPETGELLFYGYEVSGDASRDMAFCVADAQGNLVREEWFEAPYASMVHDFAITKDYVIFPLFPTIADLERMKQGGPHWMSDIAQDAYIGVMPRKGTVKDLRWFRRPGGQAFHVINAFNDGDVVHVDLCLSEMNAFPYIPDVSGAPYDPRRSATLPTRLTMEMSQNSEQPKEQMLSRAMGDVPRIDERHTGRRYRYAYMGMVDPAGPMLMAGPVGPGFNMVGKIDLDRGGAVDAWSGDGHTTFQEPQFVATGEGEGEGYVLAILERHAENRSDLGVFDAMDLAKGPIAIARLPLRLRSAVHGNWAQG